MTQWGLDNLFNPGKRHMDDEKRRLQSTREEIGDASGGRRIDLEGGVVSISVPGRRSAPEAPETSESADTRATADATADDATDDDATALEPALDAEAVPALALGADAEIEPEVVDEVEPAVVTTLASSDAEPEAVVEPEPVAPAESEPVAQAEPEPVAPPEPVQPVAPRRRAVSASAWARRG